MKLDKKALIAAASELDERISNGTAVLLGDATGITVRFIGSVPETWGENRSLYDAVMSRALAVVPDFLLDSIMDSREIENTEQVREWIPEVRDALSATRKAANRLQSSIIGPIDDVQHDVVSSDELQFADIRLRKANQLSTLTWPFLQSDINSELVVRLNAAEVDYLIEQLTAISNELRSREDE